MTQLTIQLDSSPGEEKKLENRKHGTEIEKNVQFGVAVVVVAAAVVGVVVAAVAALVVVVADAVVLIVSRCSHWSMSNDGFDGSGKRLEERVRESERERE